ncbi:hemicentin-1-like [Periophthalmus magnuspinnatus]|uniref:hemicentin-1-like n=1 Tax=Periophthalmus magnuspinnatus TaxID=409849 RepID=UPI0024371985|nr:hemicentin-1-like [Periophthalmus magnuspinnatus]
MRGILGATLFVLFSSGTCHGAGVITFDLLRVPTTETVTFTTSVQPTGTPFLAVTWSFNGITNIITSTDIDVVGSGYENRITLDKTTGSLMLGNLTEKDSGKYELIIITQTGLQHHGTAELKVLSKVSGPSIDCPTVNVVEGLSSLNLTCEAEGSVEDRAWLKDGQPLLPGDKFSFSEGNRMLTISLVDRGDTGQFQCNASNEVSSAVATCGLTVYYGPDPPQIIQKPIGAELEDRVTLTCSADSLPPASFVWTFKHVSLKGDVFYIEEMEEHHLGMYTCTATNSVTGQLASAEHFLRDSSASVTGSVSLMLSIALTSVRLMKTLSSPPPYNTHLQHLYLNLKQSHAQPAADMETSLIVVIFLGAFGLNHGTGVLPDYLTATAGGKITFTTMLAPSESLFQVITWNFANTPGINNNIIVSSSTNVTNAAYADRITLFKATGSLELRDLTIRDNGDYSVTIIPQGAAQQLGRCKLQVYVPISNVAVNLSSSDLVEFNSSVTFSCSAFGSSLSFLWLNGSTEVTASDRVHLTDGGATLTIASVWRYDQGPFRCQVTNAISNGISDPVHLSVSYGPENLNFTTFPSQEYIAKGSDLVLNCIADSKPSAEINWFLNGNLLSYTGPQCTVQNIQMNDSGSYSCQAFNRKTLRYAASTVLPIIVLEPVSNALLISNVTEMWEFNSSAVQMSCSASGSSLSFMWFNGSSEITTSSRVQLTNGNTTLTLIMVNRFDQGPFTCHAFNPVSSQSSDPISLTIIFGPEKINLTISPLQEHYDEGADVSLLCLTASGPPAFIQWFVNGGLLPHTGAELRLVNLQISQNGIYSCQAYNNRTMKNETSQFASITVVKSDIANVVISPSSTDLVEFNSSVTLSCSCSGSFPSFEWLNGSSELKTSDRVFLTDKDSTLTIINTTRYDQGPYLCHAFNHFSNGTSDALLLSISYGPENIKLKQFPPQLYHQKGANVSFICSADSKPAVQLQWFFNGRPLSYTKPELHLLNINMNFSGNYSCQAYNNKTLRYAKSVTEAILVQEPVNSVEVTSNISVLMEYSSSVSLSCSASGSSLSFLWLNGSTEVTASDRVHLMDGGATLTIVNASRYDLGPFRCNVSNGVSARISQPLPLYIQHGPDRTTIVGPESAHAGDLTMLYCSTESLPTAKFTWHFNGNPTGNQGAVYVIRSTKSTDSGTYNCTAVNLATSQSQMGSHELKVLDFSSCDCMNAAGRAILITAGTCLLIAIVCAVLVCCVKKRKRLNSNYPPHLKEKRSVKQQHSDVYKITRPELNDLYAVPLKKKRNEAQIKM